MGPGGAVPFPRRTGMWISARWILELTQYDFDGWAVVEWECALKHPEDGARGGRGLVRTHIIRVTERAFDDFARRRNDEGTANRKMLGIG